MKAPSYLSDLTLVQNAFFFAGSFLSEARQTCCILAGTPYVTQQSATKLKKKFFMVQLSVNRASSIVSPFATKSWNSTLSSSSSSSSSSSDIIIIIIGHKVGGGLRTEEEGISFQVSNINSQQPLPPKLIRNHMSKNIQLEYYHQSQVFKECNQGDINCSSLPAMMDLVEVENLRGNNSESAWEESPQFMSPWVSQSFDHLNVTWPKPAYGRQGLD